MPTTADDLLKKLIVKAGVAYDGDFTAIPDDVATSIDNALLTIAAATNNHPDVKKVYFAQAYNGLDAEIKGLITEFGLSDDIKAEIEAAGGSTKKAVTLVRKIKEISEKAVPGDKDAAKKHLETITELNKKLAQEIEKQTILKTDFDNQLKGIKIKTELKGKTGTLKTMFDDLDPQAKDAAIDALLTKALNENDAEFTFDEKGTLSIKKKDGSNLFGDNHTQVTPQAFIDKTLSKILKVTPATITTGNNSTPPALAGSGENKINQALKAANAENLANYEAASKNGVAV